ncbi:DUF3592 domain-containing protein [Chitinibacteraceae bacterium HSL-7]
MLSPLNLFKYLFAAVGVLLLMGALWSWKSTSDLLKHAEHAQGTVVELVESISSDDSSTYKPMVEYRTQAGQHITFTSSTGSYPPSFDEGEKVDVLYLPSRPQEAQINETWQLWFPSILLSVLATPFVLIGAGIQLAQLWPALTRKRLQTHGVRIEADYHGVERNQGISVNDEHPYRIVARWQDPATQQTHVFKSENLWFDPSRHLDRRKLSVLIAPGNPKRYYVDVSFLTGPTATF